MQDSTEHAVAPSADSSAGRLFVGVDLSDDVRDQLQTQMSLALFGIDLPGKLIPAENWHITLRFLGNTRLAMADKLKAVLADEQLGRPFQIQFDKLGAFPTLARAGVLWVGVGTGADRLKALAATVEKVVRYAGFPAEERPYTPHLTLSRIKPPVDVRTLILRGDDFPVNVPVREVVLFRSHQERTVMRYEKLATYPLLP